MKRLIKKAEEQSLKEKLIALKPQFAEVAQREYDAWQVGEDGYSEGVGYGGICQEIAREITNVCEKNGINAMDMQAYTEQQHVWTVAYKEWPCSGAEECGDDDCDGEHTMGEAFIVDIHPNVYEEGGGFTWTKIPDVEIEASDVDIFKYDWENFKESKEEDW